MLMNNSDAIGSYVIIPEASKRLCKGETWFAELDLVYKLRW